MRKELSLIAVSNSAHAPVISLNRYRPTATVEATVRGIVVIASASVLALEVTRSSDINAHVAGANVHTLSQAGSVPSGNLWPRSHRIMH